MCSGISNKQQHAVKPMDLGAYNYTTTDQLVGPRSRSLALEKRETSKHSSPKSRERTPTDVRDVSRLVECVVRVCVCCS